MALEDTLALYGGLVWTRFLEMLSAPLSSPDMVWSIAPLIISVLFMTIYFGRYQREELGWNTAFGNTMVFIFMALSLLKELYHRGGAGSIANLYADPFTLVLSAGLIGASVFLMLITSLHLIPKRIAFFLFSAVPVNVALYVLLCAVYAKVPLDSLTAGAAVVLFLLIFLITKVMQLMMRATGLADLKVEVPFETAPPPPSLKGREGPKPLDPSPRGGREARPRS